jgi:tetratricopeptide (TPR) repeat protein
VRYLCIILGLCLLGLPVGGACGGSAKKAKSEKKSKKSKKSKKRQKDKERRPERDNDADSAYRKAIDAEADNKKKDANRYYQIAIERDSKHRKANQRYVHFLIDNGKTSKALRVAQRFFDNLPGKSVSYHTLADAADANGDYKKVASTMSGLLAFDEDDATAYEIRGRARLKLKDNELGISDIRRAVKMEPKNPDFLISLASGLMRTNNRQEARKVLAAAIKADRRSSRAYLLLGLLARMEDKKPESLKHLKQAVANDPEDARAHFQLGITQNLLSKDKAAEASFGRAVELDPENGIYWYTYGELLRLLGRSEEAVAAYRKSVSESPENTRAWERLAETLVTTKELDEAIKQLRRGIGKVTHPPLYFLLAKVYVQANRKKRAIEALENYLEEAAEGAPNRRAAKKLLKRLKR